jgi:hypothetical protein
MSKNKKEWDRSKQTYFILRRGDPWNVSTIDGKYVCDFPAYFNQEETVKQICFANNDEEVLNIVSKIGEKHDN